MGGDALAIGEHFDGPPGEPDLDGFLREAVGHAVVVPIDIDVKIDLDPALAPCETALKIDPFRRPTVTPPK